MLWTREKELSLLTRFSFRNIYGDGERGGRKARNLKKREKASDGDRNRGFEFRHVTIAIDGDRKRGICSWQLDEEAGNFGFHLVMQLEGFVNEVKGNKVGLVTHIGILAPFGPVQFCRPQINK